MIADRLLTRVAKSTTKLTPEQVDHIRKIFAPVLETSRASNPAVDTTQVAA